MGFIDRLNNGQSDVEATRESLFDSGLGTDGSDIYANGNQLFVEFYHLPSDKSVAFKAFIKDWSDKFDSSYKSEEVYGRNDPIHTFQGTKREISLSWQVVAATAGEAQNNLARVSLLSQFLYPSYHMEKFTVGQLDAKGDPVGPTQQLDVGTMTKAPLIKVRFANLILDSKAGVVESVNAKHGGLLCALTGLNISADQEAGFIDATGVATPKVLELSTTMLVIHQHSLGWANKTWLGNTDGNAEGFPYQAYGPGAASDRHIEDRYAGGSGTTSTTPPPATPATDPASTP